MLKKQYGIKNFSRGLTILTLFRLHRCPPSIPLQSNQFLAYSACIFCVSSVKITWLAVYNSQHEEQSTHIMRFWCFRHLSDVVSFASIVHRPFLPVKSISCVFCMRFLCFICHVAISTEYHVQFYGNRIPHWRVLFASDGWNDVVT